MNLTRSAFLVAVACAFTAGCGSGDLESVEQLPAESEPSDAERSDFEQGVRGTLLTSVQLSEHHRIDFFELTSGGTVIREEYSMDVPTEARLPQLKHLDGLAATFGALRPDEVVPASLLDADARDALRKRANAENELHASEDTDEKADLGGAPLSTRAQAATSCSADLLGDGWGGQWFLDNHCASGPAPYKWCWANSSGYSTGGFDVYHQFVWTQFEGDFNRAGSFQLFNRSCGLFGCEWQLDVWASIPPRRVQTWKPSHSKVKISSSSPCSHQGVVFQW